MSLLFDLSQVSSPCVIIIRGIPGSGKSTLALRFLQLIPDAQHCEADHYFINKQGEYIFNGRKIKLAHEFCQQNMKDALQAGKSVVVSNTTIRLWELDVLLNIAAEYKADKRIVHCCGEFVNTHNVPAEIVARMASAYEPFAEEFDYTPII